MWIVNQRFAKKSFITKRIDSWIENIFKSDQFRCFECCSAQWGDCIFGTSSRGCRISLWISLVRRQPFRPVCIMFVEKSQWALSFYVDPKRLCQIVQQRKINLEPHNFDGLRPVMQICPLGKRGSVLRSVHLWVRKCVKSRAFLLLHRASSPPLSERRATTNLPTNIHSSVWLVNSVNGA